MLLGLPGLGYADYREFKAAGKNTCAAPRYRIARETVPRTDRKAPRRRGLKRGARNALGRGRNGRAECSTALLRSGRYA
jgi:hypothetical protein